MPDDVTICLGTNLHPGGAETMRRQRESVASVANLNLKIWINLQFKDDSSMITDDRLVTVATLETDSITVSGVKGTRKSIVTEMLDTLSRLATAHACEYIGFYNSDIHITPEAIARIKGWETCLFSRMNRSPETRQQTNITIYGIDLIVIRNDWWRTNRHRFRNYIVGEMGWDCVFTAICLCHSRGILLNRDPLILHEEHEGLWKNNSPFSRYSGSLLAMDSLYFSIWCEYVARLEQLRKRNAPLDEELALQKSVFVWAPSVATQLLQTARTLKARASYSLHRLRNR